MYKVDSVVIDHFEVSRIVCFYCYNFDQSVQGPMWGLLVHDQHDEFRNGDAVYGDPLDFPENREDLDNILYNEEGITCFFSRKEDGAYFVSVLNEYELEEDYHICQIDPLGRIVYAEGYTTEDVREFIFNNLAIDDIVRYSGLSNAEFCRRNEIKISTFYGWKNRSRKTPRSMLRLLAGKYGLI